MDATIYDVSRLAGVSTATVSRTFSNPGQVRDATRRKVFEAAEILHYSPNAIARAMVRQRTDKIAFLICKKDATILDEFYARICESIMRRTIQSDRQLVISTAADWAQAAGTAQNQQVEGVMLGGSAQADMVSEFQSKHIAVVLVNNRMPGFDLPCVLSDEYGGVRLAVEHLLQRGHRSIAMIAGRFSPYIVGERYNAFLQIMEESGLKTGTPQVAMCDPAVESAAQTAMDLLSRKDRPTAILGANDVVAAGVLKAAQRLGLKVPEDLAVVGFDDSTICGVVEPELTSVHIDCRRIGEVGVDHLHALLNGEECPPVTIIPAKLQIRCSS